MTDERETDVGRLVEHLFREQSGRMVSVLVGIFGLRNLELAEDVVQEALLKAMRVWSFGTVPENPAGWLMQVAKNRALDVLRRESRAQERQSELAEALENPRLVEPTPSSDEIRDDQLRMIFACCHPELSRSGQVALTLKTLCGFNVAEIARAFLIGEETAAKRLTRARHTLRDSGARFEIPEGSELSARLEAVHEVLYLLFNEGYNASQGAELIRRDLSEEAIRLARLLAAHRATNTPATCALLALFLLQAARFEARTSTAGEILLLDEQDRSAWDKRLIAKGMSYLERAASGEKLSRFHFEAGIAACHAGARSYAATDWRQIVSLYDGLLSLQSSPVVALNRAVAVAKVSGAEAGLAALPSRDTLENYYLYYAVRADFHARLDHHSQAADDLRRALSLTNIPIEQQFLRLRLVHLRASAATCL